METAVRLTPEPSPSPPPRPAGQPLCGPEGSVGIQQALPSNANEGSQMGSSRIPLVSAACPEQLGVIAPPSFQDFRTFPPPGLQSCASKLPGTGRCHNSCLWACAVRILFRIKFKCPKPLPLPTSLSQACVILCSSPRRSRRRQLPATPHQVQSTSEASQRPGLLVL